MASLDDIIVTNGSQQALDLVARVLIDPGDVVTIEDPCYPAALAVFRAMGARVVPVPVDKLPRDARLVYVTPAARPYAPYAEHSLDQLGFPI